MTMKLTSSWMNEIVQLQKGPGTRGVFIGNTCRFEPARQEWILSLRTGRERDSQIQNQRRKLHCSLVPIWASATRNDEYRISFGTGEYKLSMELKRDLRHNRTVSQELEERPEAQKSNGTFGRHIDPQLAGCFQPAME